MAAVSEDARMINQVCITLTHCTSTLNFCYEFIIDSVLSFVLTKSNVLKFGNNYWFNNY